MHIVPLIWIQVPFTVKELGQLFNTEVQDCTSQPRLDEI